MQKGFLNGIHTSGVRDLREDLHTACIYVKIETLQL